VLVAVGGTVRGGEKVPQVEMLRLDVKNLQK
jgi:hypothetical protein